MRKICTKYGRQRSFANLVLRSTNGPKLLSFFFWFRNNAFMVMACLWQNQQFFIEEDPTYICYVYIIY